MVTTRDRVIEEALSLPADVRLSLVEKLLMSLNLPTDTEIDRIWAEEAENRVSQIEAGEVKPVPGEEVFSKIRAKYKK
jgi:putative addiction module component (TIGR02574 family)